MSQDLERVYTINLGKVLLSQSQHRAVRAINMIKEFARHHMKTEEIKIEEDLAHQVWSRGVRNPPRKIRVRMSKTDEGYVLVSRYDEEVETIFHIPLESFLKTMAVDPDPTHNIIQEMHTFEYRDQIVWGASARIWRQIHNRLRS